jgi:predicted GIY-YIG superfamily endonuclease
MYYLYILHSARADKFYIGYSSDPWKRIIEHNTVQHNTFTSKYRPWELAVVFKVGSAEKDAVTIYQKTEIPVINKQIDQPLFYSYWNASSIG